MQAALNEKENRILAFLRRFIHEHGYPPSVREIGGAVGLKSPSTVHGYLLRLEEKGLLRRDPAKPRAMEVLYRSTAPKRMVFPPLVGRVQAGQPVLAVEDIEDTLPLPFDLARSDDCFVLTVRGDSMTGAGILHGDYIVVGRGLNVNNGDIVVALVGDEATVKRYYKEKDGIRLQPENPAMEPMRFPEVEILGKVTAVIRSIV
ncbi:MAG: transcriptional repressor LexA [Clostridiales bacterium]|jgi:repressor LexA|nr:transcriptional repressor LexA [Clostridiales bacterium]